MLLIAKKRIRYPRGADGVQYEVGDTFETVNERDAKALTLIRFAEEAPKRPLKKTLTLKPAAAIATTAAPPVVGAVFTGIGGGGTGGGEYARRDMRAED